MSPCRDGGADEDLYNVHSGGCSVTHIPSGERREDDLCHVNSGGHSVIQIPNGGWEQREASLPGTQ